MTTSTKCTVGVATNAVHLMKPEEDLTFKPKGLLPMAGIDWVNTILKLIRLSDRKKKAGHPYINHYHIRPLRG